MKTEEDQEELNYILKTDPSKASSGLNIMQELDNQMEQYEMYKINFVRNIVFDPKEIGLSKFINL